MAQTTTSDAADLKAYDIHPGQVYRTALGERVEIVADDGPYGKPLKVRYPERDPQLDENGEPLEAHVQFMSRYSFADAGNYEGFTLISEDGPTEDALDEDAPENLSGAWTDKTPRCPLCGSFMGTGFDGMGLPAASCGRSGCEGFMDDRELVDGGHFREE